MVLDSHEVVDGSAPDQPTRSSVAAPLSVENGGSGSRRTILHLTKINLSSDSETDASCCRMQTRTVFELVDAAPDRRAGSQGAAKERPGSEAELIGDARSFNFRSFVRSSIGVDPA